MFKRKTTKPTPEVPHQQMSYSRLVDQKEKKQQPERKDEAKEPKQRQTAPASTNPFDADVVAPAISASSEVYDYTGEWQGQKLYFQEHFIAADGRCGHSCLGLSPDETVDELLKNAEKLTIRELAAPEIRAAFIAQNLPAAMCDSNWEALSKNYIAAQETLDTVTRNINNTLGFTGKDRLESGPLITYLSTQRNHTGLYKQLLEARTQWIQVETQLDLYCCKKSTYNAFICEYLNKGGWLSYLRDPKGKLPATTTFDALAQLKNIELIIWQISSPRVLHCVHAFKPRVVERTVHLFHTSGNMHYNLLKTVGPGAVLRTVPVEQKDNEKESKKQNSSKSADSAPSKNPFEKQKPVLPIEMKQEEPAIKAKLPPKEDAYIRGAEKWAKEYFEDAVTKIQKRDLEELSFYLGPDILVDRSIKLHEYQKANKLMLKDVEFKIDRIAGKVELINAALENVEDYEIPTNWELRFQQAQQLLSLFKKKAIPQLQDDLKIKLQEIKELKDNRKIKEISERRRKIEEELRREEEAIIKSMEAANKKKSRFPSMHVDMKKLNRFL